MINSTRSALFLFTGIFICLFSPAANAEFKTYWKTTVPLGSFGEAVKPAPKKYSSFDFSRYGTPDMPKRKFPGMNFTDWRDRVNMAAGESGMEGDDRADFRYTAGIPFLSLPLFAWSKRNANNEFIGYRGIGYGLGYLSKTYFNPVHKHAWNTFWHWGTVYFVIPYIGVGTEFMTNNFFFEVGTFYILPYIGIGFHF